MPFPKKNVPVPVEEELAEAPPAPAPKKKKAGKTAPASVPAWKKIAAAMEK